MREALVIRPFTASLILEGVERRLEEGERIGAEELAHWGNSVNHLVNTGRLALVHEVASADASMETLVEAIVDRSDELDEHLVGKLNELLGGDAGAAPEDLLANASDEDLLAEAGRPGLALKAGEAEGDGAKGVEGDLGGVGDGSSGSPPSADDPNTQPEAEAEQPGSDGGAKLELAPEPQPEVVEPEVEREADAGSSSEPSDEVPGPPEA